MVIKEYLCSKRKPSLIKSLVNKFSILEDKFILFKTFKLLFLGWKQLPLNYIKVIQVYHKDKQEQ